MGCDMVVALARATLDGHVLFGHNNNRPAGEGQSLRRVPGRHFALGEVVRATHLPIPQARQTATVLACPASGQWGYRQGINEHGVAAGVTPIRTRLGGSGPGLTGPDLVRLALERAASARQAVDVATDLIIRHGRQAGLPRHGQAESGADFALAGATDPEEGADSALLIADGREAFVLETCGCHWALQVVGEVRAVSDFCHLRQDWDRISRGLADLAIERGWWPANGTKLDFAGALAHPDARTAQALRRWGRATVLLEEQNGQIHLASLRHLLGDHGGSPRPVVLEEYEADQGTTGRPGLSLCQHALAATEVATAASLIATLGPGDGQLPLAWWAFGPPCSSIYFPFSPEGDIPPAFQDESGAGSPVWRQMMQLSTDARRDPHFRQTLLESLAALQEQYDQHAREFLAEAAPLKAAGVGEELALLARSFMQHNLECWENLCDELGSEEGSQRPRARTAQQLVGAHGRVSTQPLEPPAEEWLEP